MFAPYDTCRRAVVCAAAVAVLLLLTQTGTGQVAPSSRVTTNLAGLFLFDEGSGDTARDRSGLAGGAPLQVAGGVTWITGRSGVTFPGVGNPFGRQPALSIDSPARLREVLTGTGAFTFEIWVRPRGDIRTLRAGFASQTDADSRDFAIEPGPGGTQVYLNSTAVLTTGAAVEEIHQWVVTYDGASATAYRNGALAASAPYTAGIAGWSASSSLMIGSVPNSTTPWRGDVYLAAIYSRALTADEVAQNFRAGSAGVTAISRVTGRIVDGMGAPVGGASVKVDRSTAGNDPAYTATTTTAADGTFSFDVPDGMYFLCITAGSTAVCANQFSARGGAAVNLGPIMVMILDGDSDGDGLSDSLERMGWKIYVDEQGKGELIERSVTSEPTVADTDRDGIPDGIEFALKTDPRSRDTDMDLLSDFAEVQQFKSNPNNVDTDGDARGPERTAQPNPSLFDGIEYMLSRTSPTLADTDGDGLTDYQEILGGGFNPRRADLPEWDLQVTGDPNVVMNVTTRGSAEVARVSATLRRDQASQTRNDASSTRQTTENTQSISAEAEASFPPGGGSVKVSASAEFKQGVVNESSASFTAESVRESQNTYEDQLRNVEERDYRDGTVQVAMRLRNTSELSFKVKKLSIVAFQLNPTSQGSFSVTGTLSPELAAGSDGFLLGPGDNQLFVASAPTVAAENILRLIRNPTSLVFEAGGFSAFQTDAKGEELKDFAVVGQDVVERCALIVIDYEDGRVERHFVATNVRRNPDGSGAGITMREALQDILGVEYETVENKLKERVLSRVRDKASSGTVRYWLAFGSSRSFDATPGAVARRPHFDDIVLRNGDRVSLVFNSDADGDRLYGREEALFGTNPAARDSDGDSISDYDEVKTGWKVPFRDVNGIAQAELEKQVYSDPRFADADRDGWPDATERTNRTDPNNRDTDGDGYDDPDDPSPLDAPRGAGIPSVGLTAHFPMDRQAGDEKTGTVRNVASTTAVQATVQANDSPYIKGQYFDPSATGDKSGLYDFTDRKTNSLGRAYYFQPKSSNSSGAGFAFAKTSEPVIPVDRTQSFTIAAWVYPNFEDDKFGGVVAEQAGWASLYIGVREAAGTGLTVHFAMPNAQGTTVVVSECPEKKCQPVTKRQWSLYAGVYNALNQTITLFRDGRRVAGPVVVGAGATPTLADTRFFLGGGKTLAPCLTTTVNLTPAGTTSDLLCGPLYAGGMDDVRVYSRALNPDEVLQLYRENGYGR